MLRRIASIVVAFAGLGVAAYSGDARAHDEPVVGSLVGAGIGAVVAGPPGAAVGAVIGAAIGSTVAHESDHGRYARRDAKYVEYSRAEIRPSAPPRGRYAAYAPYANAGPACAPQRREHRTTIVYREDGARGVRTSLAAKPAYRKVCRYVPVNALR